MYEYCSEYYFEDQNNVNYSNSEYINEQDCFADFFIGNFNDKEEKKKSGIGSILKNAVLAAGALSSIGLGAYSLYNSHIHSKKVGELANEYQDYVKKLKDSINRISNK